jgi:hypothetical protein
MGILDEAIKEHLELKRQHGADDSELKQLEDEAFGPPERPGADESPQPGPAAETPTEFMAQPDLDDARPEGTPAEAEAEAQPSRREMPDIQEPPEAKVETPSEEPPAEEPPGAEESAAEHEAVPAPPASGPDTEERHVIADQPTEMFDVEEEFAASGAPAPAPADEELVAEETAEPKLGQAEPLPDPEDERDEELEDEDDFFDEKRLSEELDQALEAPAEPVAAEPISEEHTEVREPISEEHTEVREPISDEHPVEEPARSVEDADVLDDTPEFLEENPEDEQLWFEQKPPKDFDFDD